MCGCKSQCLGSVINRKHVSTHVIGNARDAAQADGSPVWGSDGAHRGAVVGEDDQCELQHSRTAWERRICAQLESEERLDGQFAVWRTGEGAD